MTYSISFIVEFPIKI